MTLTQESLQQHTLYEVRCDNYNKIRYCMSVVINDHAYDLCASCNHPQYYSYQRKND